MCRQSTYLACLVLLLSVVNSAFAVGPATQPYPADGARHGDTWVTLSWQGAVDAGWHHVYFGDNFNAVSNDDATGGTFQRWQTETSFKVGTPGHPYPDGLVRGRTYYWRIDEQSIVMDVRKGVVWRFTVESPPIPAVYLSPANKATNQSINVDLRWANGGGATSYGVYFGTDPTPDAGEYKGIRTGTVYDPGTLKHNTTYYWRIDARNIAGTTTGGAWRFTTEEEPAIGGGVKAEYFAGKTPQGTPCLTQIEPNINYNWGNGEVACGRSDQVSVRWTADLEIAVSDTYTFYTTSDDGVRLYLDGERIIDNWTSHAPQDDKSPPLELIAGRVYSLVMEYYENAGGAVAQLYWEAPAMERQIIPAGPLQPPQPSGPLGGAGTGTPLEGFEHFTDNVAAGEAIFQTWIGGPDNGTGARVGHPDPPYAERIIVFSGNQSMPLYYNNSKSPHYSQADRTWEIPQVWGVGDTQTLGLAVHGRAGNDPAQLYVEVEDVDGAVAVVSNDNDPDILIRDEWTQWIIPLQTFRDQGVDIGAVWRMSIGMRGTVYWQPFDSVRPYANSDSLVFVDEIQDSPKRLRVTVSCDDPLYKVRKAMLTFTPHGGSGNITVPTNNNGYKAIMLVPAAYDINVKAGGFAEKDIDGWNEWGPGTSTDLQIKLTAASDVREYRLSDTWQDIKDDDDTWFYLDIEDVGTIADLNVMLSVDHDLGTDLEVALYGPGIIDPTTTGVRLSVDDGSWTTGSDTLFDDEAPGGEPRHRKPKDKLSAFDGKNVKGQWTLRIKDKWPGDVGKLRLWWLIVELE
ncbi:MAG: PA14 domain-containing protein [Planctomycetota bacterium]